MKLVLEVHMASGVKVFSETKSLSSLDGQPDGKAVIERFQYDQ